MTGFPFARKSLGQHWLADLASLQAMRQAAELSITDTVLEIGPGAGTLTELLVERVARVVAVELDEELVQQLSRRLTAANLQVIQQDIMRFDLTALPPGYKVVANIPFYLTSNLIRVLSESSNPPKRAVLLVQKEVAQRVAARPGAMSILSVSAQFYWQVSLGQVVAAKLFSPPPKVDSQILILNWPSKPIFPGIDHQVFFRIVKAGFSGRRKKLLNSLSAGLRLNKADVAGFLAAAKLDSNLRAQNLTLEDWYNLYKAISKPE